MRKDFKYRIIVFYCIIFYALMIYKWLNGVWLYQIEPTFFFTRKDLTTWLLMESGIHQWLLDNKSGWLLFDALFYAMPLLYFLIYKFQKKFSPGAAVLMLLVNWLYVQCYTLYPSNSIEAHIAWLLFPVAFIPANEKTFRLLIEGLRYFFLYFFFSAGVWKIAQGGLFNPLQMSGVLLYQHNQQLASVETNFQTKTILYLIQHQWLSYCLYVSSALLEFSFAIGFFTKKYDRLLCILFLLFAVVDYFIMRIAYFEVLPFLLAMGIKPSGRS